MQDPHIWLSLYAAADRLQELAPWKHMHDGHTVVVDPDNQAEIMYCGVMGSLGEFFGVNIYLGTILPMQARHTVIRVPDRQTGTCMHMLSPGLHFPVLQDPQGHKALNEIMKSMEMFLDR